MQLPALAEGYLAQNRSLRSVVDRAITQTEELISDRPDFFPEYTDHGPDHNTCVINTSIALLKEEGKSVLTPSDVATLCLSVLLHDCGMHLTPEGFNTLVSPSNRNRITDLDSENWSEIWANFLLEARRFDGRKLNELFGSREPVREPPKEPRDLTQRDRMLIGEFIRRNHPRIAHEIALFGFPAADGKFLDILNNCEPEFADIAGLVARSHGMGLRNAVDILRKKYDEREFMDIHAIVLMALLRIADYLQIQSERAPKKVTEVRRFNSPFSEGEWKVHQSIRNITNKQEDPEAILIDSLPEDVETFLKVKAWLDGLQNELDKTWAILGESYGRYPDLEKFQLKIRRIRSNFDQMDEFSERVDFVPDRIAFEASSPDLLSLLAKPLYGNDPQIGIRELVQNAADAVLEREFIEGKRPTRKIEGFDTDILVYAEFEENKPKSVIIEDRGIGMNIDIIKNYFLRAGASFRNSSVWRRHFADESGKSQINRSGRFGIGALAAFLIGEEVEVTTRRFDDVKGYKFVADLESGSISVKRVNCEIGTRIVTNVDEDLTSEVGKIFEEDQHRMPFYSVKYPKMLKMSKSKQIIDNNFSFDPKDDWLCIGNIEGYNDVYWATKIWKGRYRSFEENVFCNGIHLFEVPSYGSDQKTRILFDCDVAPNIRLHHPSIYIFDRDGRLPLTLQRNSMADKDTVLSQEISKSMTDDLIAQSIAYAPERSVWDGISSSEIESREIYCQPSGTGRNRYVNWTWYNNGWLPLEDAFLSNRVKYTLIIHSDIGADAISMISARLEDFRIIWNKEDDHRLSAKSKKKCANYLGELRYGSILDMTSSDREFISVFSKKVYDQATSGKIPNYLEIIFRSGIKKLGDLYVFSSGEHFGQIQDSLDKITADMDGDFLFSIISGSPKVNLKDDHILVHKWNDLIGLQSIPPCFEERQTAFPRAFELLGDRIEYHRQQIRRQDRKPSRNAA